MNSAKAVRWLYHYVSGVNPALGTQVARLSGFGRRVVQTPRGAFWIDPLSDFGARLVADGEHDPSLIAVLEKFLAPASVFVDLGANEGYFSVIASRLCGATGRVYAIEPQPDARDVMLKNFELNGCRNVEIWPVAVSNAPGTVDLHIHPATNTGATSVWKTARSAVRSVEVECASLEELLARHGVDRVDLLKIDIEGSEYEAILGSRRIFERGAVRVVAIEYHAEILASRGLSGDEIHAFLLSANYAPDPAFAGVYVKRR